MVLANTSTAPKDGVFAQILVQKNPPPHGDDRHSKNDYPVNSVHQVKPLAVYLAKGSNARVAVAPFYDSDEALPRHELHNLSKKSFPIVHD
jgi:hypothetical protein